MIRILLVLSAISVTATALVSGVAKPQASSAPPGAQAPAKPATAQQPPANPAAQVAPSAPVITIHGLCPSGASSSSPKAPSACATVLTKTQFEELISAINVNGQTLPPSALRNIAESYAQFLTLADAAQKARIDKDPKVQEMLRIARLRVLAEAYRHSLEEKYHNPPADEITAYYNKNLAKYEQVKLSRLFVPKFNPKTPQDGRQDFEKKAQQVATDLRERAVKGEDLDKLQKEAYSTLDLANPQSTTDMGTRKKGSLPPAVEQEVFALKPSEVTKLASDPGGFSFYKLLAKETIPLDQARTEVSRAIYQQKIEAAMKAVIDATHADLNEQYFGPKPAPGPTGIQGTQQPAQGNRPTTSTAPASAPGKPAPRTSKPPK